MKLKFLLIFFLVFFSQLSCAQSDNLSSRDGINWGKKTSTNNKTFCTWDGGAQRCIRYNTSSNEWEFSNDGSTYTAVGGGGGFENPMTTNNDMIYQSAGAPARLPGPTVGQTLTGGASGVPTWAGGWFVEASIEGVSNTSVSTSSVTTRTQLTNSTLTLTNTSTTGAVAANITCADGTSPTGTTCTAANESFGISFPVPSSYSGRIEVCAEFAHFVTLDSGSGLLSNFLTWRIVQTAESTSATIEVEGRGQNQFYVNMEREANAQDFNDQMGTCSVFEVTAGDTVTYRLMYKKNATPAGMSANGVQVTGGALVKFSVKPIR